MISKKQKFTSLKIKTGRIVTFMFLFLSVSIYFILNIVMHNKIEVLEDRYIKDHVERVQNEMDENLNIMSKVVCDWATWDDTYSFIYDNNEEYITTNLNEYNFSNLDLNEMVFINKYGNIVYNGSMGEELQQITEIPETFTKYLNDSPIKTNEDPNYRVKGIIMMPKGPLIISSCPILPSNGQGEVRGNLIMGYYLSDEKINIISEKLNLEVKIINMGELNYDIKELLYSDNNEEPFIVRNKDNNKIEAYSVLKDVYGNPVEVLIIEMDSDISKIAINGIKIILIFLMATCLFVLAVIQTFLHKDILIRIIQMSKDIKLIGNKKMFSQRLKKQEKNDEISVVSDEINSMLDQLEDSQLKLLKIDKELKKSNEELERKVQERTEQLSRTNENLVAEIKERKKAEEKVKHIAYHDDLTGLPNRLMFTEQLNHAIALAKRTGKNVAIMFLDLDGFKVINDTMGHPAGDKLLKEVSKRLLSALRETDIVSRIGGDEFLVLIENIDDIKSIKKIADKILKKLNSPLVIDGQECFVTTSIGIAICPTDGNNAETLIKNADIAMYKAKEEGKNKYIFCTPLIKNTVKEILTLTNSLYRALENSEFELYYQPQVNLNTKEIVGAEALLRWNHPEQGIIPPSKFIPIAEQTGLIISIGRWVLETACKQNKIWQDKGYSKIKIAVNISVKQFEDKNIVQFVNNVLNTIGLEHKYLELEVTESIVMNKKDYVIKILDKFKAMGVHIAIDDFGTEYSSLSYLKNIPADKLKIAMPFVHGINMNTKDESITKAIIVLAKSMDMSVIAEGVETEKQLSFLSQKMCDEIQGYYFYKPMTAEKMEEVLLEANTIEKEACITKSL